MSLPDDRQPLHSGDLTSRKQEGEESRLADSCAKPIEILSQGLDANGVTQMVIGGTVTSLSLSELKDSARLSLGTHTITVKRSGKPIVMSNGDHVIVSGTQSAKGFFGVFYINESNGDNSVDEDRKMIPKWIAAGSVGLVGVLAVFVTAAIAALREPSILSVSGAARIVIYVISLVAALALGAISLFVLFMGAHLHSLLQMIDREHRKHNQ